MSPDRTRLKILFLENRSGREAQIRAAFERAPGSFDLAFASSPEEAVRAVAKDVVDVLFFSKTLCGKDSFHFMEKIRKSRLRPLALIMVTGEHSDLNEIREMVAGGDVLLPVQQDSIEQYPLKAVCAYDRVSADFIQSGLPPRPLHVLRDKYWQAVIGAQVSGVGHEINNQLTAAVAYTELLIQQTTDDAARRDLNKILKSVAQCGKILNNLLAFARTSAQAKSIESVNATIDRVVDLRSYGLRSKRIAVTRNYAELPAVFMDGQQLRQVILYVFLNAEQAIISGGAAQGNISATTSYRKEDRIVQIRIENDGPGIPPAVFTRLFEPFFSTTPGGSGLGLFEARRIVESHGGLILAERPGGPGAVFTIELPTLPASGG